MQEREGRKEKETEYRPIKTEKRTKKNRKLKIILSV